MSEPRPDHVNAEAGRDPKLATLEADLTYEAPGPPTAVGAAHEWGLILIVIAVPPGQAQSVVSFGQLGGESIEPVVFVRVRCIARGEVLELNYLAHSTSPRMSTC